MKKKLLSILILTVFTVNIHAETAELVGSDAKVLGSFASFMTALSISIERLEMSAYAKGIVNSVNDGWIMVKNQAELEVLKKEARLNHTASKQLVKSFKLLSEKGIPLPVRVNGVSERAAVFIFPILVAGVFSWEICNYGIDDNEDNRCEHLGKEIGSHLYDILHPSKN